MAFGYSVSDRIKSFMLNTVHRDGIFVFDADLK